MRVLYNFLNSKNGGGKNILDNYINQLSISQHNHDYFILTPDYERYKHYEIGRIKIIQINRMYQKNIFFLILYYYRFPLLIKKLNIDAVINFGDVVLPFCKKQVYFFDWAYAVYDDAFVWEGMFLKDKLIRKVKLLMIDSYIRSVQRTICQTSNMADRLSRKYDLKNVDVIPTPLVVKIDEIGKRGFDFQKGVKYFFYPASYSTHKNFRILKEVADLIKQNNLPFVILITVDPFIASDYLQTIKDNKLTCLHNLGIVSTQDISFYYRNCDALLFPSILESYGLPLIEAMAFEKAILVSDLDFAHSICGDSAFYFNPFDAEGILNVMKSFDMDMTILSSKLQSAKDKIQKLPSWNEFILKFEKALIIK